MTPEKKQPTPAGATDNKKNDVLSALEQHFASPNNTLTQQQMQDMRDAAQNDPGQMPGYVAPFGKRASEQTWYIAMGYDYCFSGTIPQIAPFREPQLFSGMLTPESGTLNLTMFFSVRVEGLDLTIDFKDLKHKVLGTFKGTFNKVPIPFDATAEGTGTWGRTVTPPPVNL